MITRRRSQNKICETQRKTKEGPSDQQELYFSWRDYAYEENNCLNRCGDCDTSSSHLCRRTGSVFETSYCAATATADFVFQTKRIRYWSVCDICNRYERRGIKDNANL